MCTVGNLSAYRARVSAYEVPVRPVEVFGVVPPT